MSFYTFRQNNSGGVFDFDNGLAVNVVVEADSAEEANLKAEALGLYFDGCETGADCPCCGDRWYPAADGTSTPTVYGQSPKDYVETSRFLWGDEGENVVVHYADGQTERF